jgi:anti-anti-sigma regulatory factor
MKPTVALPERLNIESLEALHGHVKALEAGVLDGSAVTSVDGAGLQWLASAVSSGWSVQGASTALEQQVAFFGLPPLQGKGG